jgi:hypothetical protein
MQPHLLCKVLTSCTGLTQLALTCGRVDDQGLGVLLTHGTSITDVRLGWTSLTTSKTDWACSWRKLSFEGTLQEFANLPLKSVQQLKVISYCGFDKGLGSFPPASGNPQPGLLPSVGQ